jgi:(p)ppGpp synthase/HD superfamily hydrolase
MELIERARVFALAAHTAVDQRRKYTGEPYINHPAAVAAIVKTVPHTDEMIAAAWLHDVVEDTAITIELIADEFGPVVAELVGWLTKTMPREGTREVRKENDRQHTAQAPAEAQTIKAADLIDNCRNIAERDPEFAKVLLKEKDALLLVMTRADPTLLTKAYQCGRTP